MALNAKSFHLCTLRVMFASNDIEEVIEYLRLDWLKLFGFSAAIAIFLDLTVRTICWCLRLILRYVVDKETVENYLEEYELAEWQESWDKETTYE